MTWWDPKAQMYAAAAGVIVDLWPGRHDSGFNRALLRRAIKQARACRIVVQPCAHRQATRVEPLRYVGDTEWLRCDDCANLFTR